jgi:hypothetical protein
MHNIPPSGKRALACFVTTLLLMTLLPAPAAAWGDEGHHIVAMIAEKNLSNAARSRVNQILGQGTTCNHGGVLARMLCASTWADGSRFTTHTFTYNWHFVDISLAERDYDENRDCEPKTQEEQAKGKCGIIGLDRARRILRGETTDSSITRTEALMFVIHVVGDLHQPLHTVKEKTGGNGFRTVFFNVPTDMHKVWDTKIIQREMGLVYHRSESEYAAALEAEIETNGLASFQQGSPIDWLTDTHATAIRDAYGTLPAPEKTAFGSGKRPVLRTDYFNHGVEVTDTQLMRGGARLALILNEDLH